MTTTSMMMMMARQSIETAATGLRSGSSGREEGSAVAIIHTFLHVRPYQGNQNVEDGRHWPQPRAFHNEPSLGCSRWMTMHLCSRTSNYRQGCIRFRCLWRDPKLFVWCGSPWLEGLSIFTMLFFFFLSLFFLSFF